MENMFTLFQLARMFQYGFRGLTELVTDHSCLPCIIIEFVDNAKMMYCVRYILSLIVLFSLK